MGRQASARRKECSLAVGVRQRWPVPGPSAHQLGVLATSGNLSFLNSVQQVRDHLISGLGADTQQRGWGHCQGALRSLLETGSRWRGAGPGGSSTAGVLESPGPCSQATTPSLTGGVLAKEAGLCPRPQSFLLPNPPPPPRDPAAPSPSSEALSPVAFLGKASLPPACSPCPERQRGRPCGPLSAGHSGPPAPAAPRGPPARVGCSGRREQDRVGA